MSLTKQKIDLFIQKIRYIYDQFGYETQIEKLDEECKEYIIDFEKKDENYLSEIADVFIVSSQLVLSNKKIQEIVEKKLARTLQRIETRYYDNIQR